MVSQNVFAFAAVAVAAVHAKPYSKAQSYAHATCPYGTITASPGGSSSLSSPAASSTSPTSSTSSSSTTETSSSSSSSSLSETTPTSSTASSVTITTSSMTTSSTFVPADLFPCTADSDCTMVNQLCDDFRCGCLNLFCQPLTTTSSTTSSDAVTDSSSSETTSSTSTETESTITPPPTDPTTLSTTTTSSTTSVFVPADLFPCTADSDCVMANQLCDDVRCGCLDLFCQPLTTSTDSSSTTTTTPLPAVHTVAAPPCNSVGDVIPNGGCNDACVCQADINGAEYCSSQFSFEDPSIVCTSNDDCPQGDFCEDLDGGFARCATGTQPGNECFIVI